jgi:hypothetical protein
MPKTMFGKGAGASGKGAGVFGGGGTVIEGIEDAELARLLSLGRLTLGVTLLVAPTRTLRVWTGDAEPSFSARLAARGLGGRDVAIAIGTLISLDAENGHGSRVRGWLEAGSVADASDTIAGLSVGGQMRPLRRVLLVATSAAAVVLGLRLAEALDK